MNTRTDKDKINKALLILKRRKTRKSVLSETFKQGLPTRFLCSDERLMYFGLVCVSLLLLREGGVFTDLTDVGWSGWNQR